MDWHRRANAQIFSMGGLGVEGGWSWGHVQFMFDSKKYIINHAMNMIVSQI